MSLLPVTHPIPWCACCRPRTSRNTSLITMSTKMLNTAGNTSCLWVNPLPVLNGRPSYIPAYGTTAWFAQNRCIILLIFVPRLQPLITAMIFFWYSEFYSFLLYINTCNRVSWHLSTSCCTNFSSNVAVPVPLYFLNPYRVSCGMMVERRRFFVMEVKNFHITSTNMIPMKYSSPFGSITIVFQVISSGRRPSWNATFQLSNWNCV